MGLLDGILGEVLGNSTDTGQPSPVVSGVGGGNRVLMALLPVLLGMLMNRQGGIFASAAMAPQRACALEFISTVLA